MGAVVPIEVKSAFVRPTDLPHTCSDVNLVQAVNEWLCGASEQEVARYLRVTKDQVPGWVNSRGWQLVADMLREDVRSVAYSHLTRVSQKTYKALNDRLDNGDPIVDEKGRISGYRPLRARDLGLLQKQVMESLDTIEKRLGMAPGEGQKVDLQKLAKALERYADAEIIPGMRMEDERRSRCIDAEPAESWSGLTDGTGTAAEALGQQGDGGVAVGAADAAGRCGQLAGDGGEVAAR